MTEELNFFLLTPVFLPTQPTTKRKKNKSDQLKVAFCTQKNWEARFAWSLVVPLSWDKIEIVATFLPLHQSDLCVLHALSMKKNNPFYRYSV